jgi:hypothetical protein
MTLATTTTPVKKSQFAKTVQHAAHQAQTFTVDVQKRTLENTAKLPSTRALNWRARKFVSSMPTEKDSVLAHKAWTLVQMV